MTPVTFTPASDAFLDELRGKTAKQLARLTDKQLTSVLVSLRMLVFGIKSIPNELMNQGIAQIRRTGSPDSDEELRMVLNVVPHLRAMAGIKRDDVPASRRQIKKLVNSRGLPPSGSRSKSERRRERRREQPNWKGEVPDNTAAPAREARDALNRLGELMRQADPSPTGINPPNGGKAKRRKS